VPIPPELVAILRAHIDTFGTAPDGRIFASERGHVVASTAISDVWAEARTLAFTPEPPADPARLTRQGGRPALMAPRTGRSHPTFIPRPAANGCI
jgi:hypothetical protein